jgi:hypothetical protein
MCTKKRKKAGLLSAHKSQDQILPSKKVFKKKKNFSGTSLKNGDGFCAVSGTKNDLQLFFQPYVLRNGHFSVLEYGLDDRSLPAPISLFLKSMTEVLLNFILHI